MTRARTHTHTRANRHTHTHAQTDTHLFNHAVVFQSREPGDLLCVVSCDDKKASAHAHMSTSTCILLDNITTDPHAHEISADFERKELEKGKL